MTTTAFVPFIDITAQNADKAPLVKGGVRAYYDTGGWPIEETANQIAKAKAAGMGLIFIDQRPGLPLFRAGIADVGDIEFLAGTDWDAASAVAQRQTHKEESTLYVSFNSLDDLKSHISNPVGVLYGVADFNWSETQSEQLLNEHSDWAYAQYGDNITNANTLVPGTNVTCGQAGCDIDVAKASWANQFLPKPIPTPGPTWQVESLRMADSVNHDLGVAVGNLTQLRNLLQQHQH